MVIDFNLYAGVYYCVKCGVGVHFYRLYNDRFVCRECGSGGFESIVSYCNEDYRTDLRYL